jgi:hypothetical protein
VLRSFKVGVYGMIYKPDVKLSVSFVRFRAQFNQNKLTTSINEHFAIVSI